MKNEKSNFIYRKIKQLNLVINEFSKENQEREKQLAILRKKYEKQYDNIFSNYEVKMTRMLRSFYGQQKYFIDLIKPEFESEVIKMKEKFFVLSRSTIESFQNFESEISKLASNVSNISQTIQELALSEDVVLDRIIRDFFSQLFELNEVHSIRIKNVDHEFAEKSRLLSANENIELNKEEMIRNYVLLSCKSLKSRIFALKNEISEIRKNFTKFLTEQKAKMANDRDILRELLANIENAEESKSAKSDVFKIVFDSKKLKVLSANTLVDFKFLAETEIQELKSELNELRQNDQREIFEKQFEYREEKNAILKNYSEIISIVKLAIEFSELSKKFDRNFKEEQLKKKIEIEKMRKKLDNEYFEQKEKFSNKSNRLFCQNNPSEIFQEEEKKYELEFHRLSDQLVPQSSEEQRQVLRYDLISNYLSEIEFENKRHSLQMLLFGLKKSAETAIKAASSNALNSVNLLRENIKRQIEINNQNISDVSSNLYSIKNNRQSSLSTFSIGSQLCYKQISLSKSCRDLSLDMQRKMDKQRMDLMNFYESKIKDIQNQKDLVKKELEEMNEKNYYKSNAIRSKLFALTETYQQLSNTELKEKQKTIDKINLKYDSQIDRLNKSIDLLKSSVSNEGDSKNSLEARIGKMNWHCELLNSQLAALTKQLRIAQRNAKNPEQQIRSQKRTKSSIQVTAIPHLKI